MVDAAATMPSNHTLGHQELSLTDTRNHRLYPTASSWEGGGVELKPSAQSLGPDVTPSQSIKPAWLPGSFSSHTCPCRKAGWVNLSSGF